MHARPPSCFSRSGEAMDIDHAAIGARTKPLEPPEVLPLSVCEDHAPRQTSRKRLRLPRSPETSYPAAVCLPPESRCRRTSVDASGFSSKHRRLWSPPVTDDWPVDSATQLVDRSSQFGLLIEFRFINSKSVRN